MALRVVGRWALPPALAVVIVGACSSDHPLPPPPTTGCPNKVVVEGAACRLGLVCNYAEPTNCTQCFAETCGADGVWSLDRPCTANGGTGGGDGGSGGSGNEGGAGGRECIDPKPGAPQVTSELAVVFAPDRTSGVYSLTFDESVTDVGSDFSWSWPGQLGAVTKVGSLYRVAFSGLTAGDEATLTVDGVDGCRQRLGRQPVGAKRSV